MEKIKNLPIQWEFHSSLLTDKRYNRLYRAKHFKAQLEIITNRKDGIKETYLYWDSYPNEFRTEKELLDFYNRLDEVSRRRLLIKGK